MAELVLDIETKNIFADVGKHEPRLLDVSLVGVYDYGTDQFSAFREHELAKLWPLLEHATRVIGFNINGFDFPVLARYYPGDIAKISTFDILDVVKDTLGFRLKLDDLVQCTLQQKKSGHGLMAVEFYKQGKWDDLIRYCLDDVRLTRDLYEFGKKRGEIYYPNRNGITKMKVNFAPPVAVTHALNLTLPL
ncbi:ribonuclease H-like domain-containing protein [Candidatus Uhrbacteria bacterium]|nr:ribonuclease H-like domain-containing protein [Candidatus Uhrbacteria bacterium]